MSQPARIVPHLWIVALLGAGGFWLWLTLARVHRVEQVSNLVETEAVIDPTSPTGYGGGLRQLIVPEHNNASCQWIVQTQQMLARHEWRVRHIDYDNAPFGREVLSPSPYRWWLGLVAAGDHLVSGRPIGLGVERAALLADPLLHLLLLIGAVAFTARRFGGVPAALMAIAVAVLFPFGGSFLPGQPEDRGLAQICALWSVLPLLAAVGTDAPSDATGLAPDARRRRGFIIAGLAGAAGLWVDPAIELPVLAGLVLGALGCARWARRGGPSEEAAPRAPWRAWALTGAGATLAACLAEYLPRHLGDLRLEHVHPLHGLAWLGAGEWLAWSADRIRPDPSVRRGSWVRPALAALPVAAVAGVALLPENRELFTADTLSSRLTNLAGSPVAANLWAWLSHDGATLPLVATCLPLILLVPAVWLLARRSTGPAHRAALALALGPVAVTLGLAGIYLRAWNTLDTALLGLLAAVALPMATAAGSGIRRAAWISGVLLGLLPGLLVLTGRARNDSRNAVTEGDVLALMERDLAHWLARAAGPGGAVVLAPPGLTTSLYFHGGLAGLGTLDRDNKAGLLAAIRIAGASSPDEAQALARSRHLDYIVIPSWDPSLDDYARAGSSQYEHTLVALLHRWLPPRWLRPVPYRVPKVAGFEGQSVAIFAVGEVQDNATALSHLAEYFVEMGQLPQAIGVADTLEHSFPADVGATVARALVAQAADDPNGFHAALTDLQTFVARGDDKVLPWDRRVSLAIALAEGKSFELARAQVRQCLADVNEPRLRSLTTVSLYRLQAMSRAFGLEIADPRLRSLARDLLPADLRDRT